MAEIATLALLARNDKGIPQGIATLVSLARNDGKGNITLAMTGKELVEFSAVA